MKRITFFLLIFFLMSAFALSAELNPLKTERADTLGRGMLRFDVGFTADGLADNTRFYHLPSVGITFGLSEKADLILDFGGLVYREGPNFEDTVGAGDLTVGLKTSPLSGSWGTLGFLIATKLPNANDEKGLGTDMQDFFFTALYTYSLEKFKFNLNLGLHVLGDNNRAKKYHYMFAAGAGVEYAINDYLTVMADVFGTVGGNNDFEETKFTLGLVGPIASGWEWGVTGSAGLTPESPDWSAGIFISKLWDASHLLSESPYHPGSGPVAINHYPFPMNSIEAWTIPSGNLYTALSFEAKKLEDQSYLYSPSAYVKYGIAEGVDVGVFFPFVVHRESRYYGLTDGTGPIQVDFKISPWHLGNFRFGISNEIEFPASYNNIALGTREMDYTLLVLSSYSNGKFSAHTNLGLLIEGKDEAVSSQNDYFVGAIGLEYTILDNVSIFGEAYGKMSGSEDDLSAYSAGGGFRFLIDKYALALYGAGGFGNNPMDWSVGISLSRNWKVAK